jgi:hypothetical protein
MRDMFRYVAFHVAGRRKVPKNARSERLCVRRRLVAGFGERFSQSDVSAQLNDPQSGLNAQSAGQSAAFAILTRSPIANLAIRAVAVPAKVAVGDGFQVKVLKTAQNGVVFRDVQLAAQDLDRDKPLVWFKKFRRRRRCHHVTLASEDWKSRLFVTRSPKCAKTFARRRGAVAFPRAGADKSGDARASPGRFSPPDALSVDAFGNCAHNFSYFQSLSPPAYFHD